LKMTAYYNEHDAEKAAWIRELIRRNMVAPGDVDERSITDVRADDLRGYTQCHFFAGIAVWSYALRLAGWPDDRPAWTGSCPCPSFSAAGKGEGFDDARHLWPAWWPLIRERRPATVFGEQVAAAIRHGWWDLVSTDLESEVYATASAVLTSAGVGGPDIRERLYWVADTENGYRRCRERGAETGIGADGVGRWGFAGVGESLRLEHAIGERKRGGDQRGLGASRTEVAEQKNRPNAANEFGDGCATASFGLADADGGQSGDGELQRSWQHGLIAKDGGLRVEHFAADALKGHWGTADWLYCTDGRWRPVEAGTFPLADGAAFRLGRLRGYGDAINAQVAKAFIESYIETRKEL
jgi:DNA (cytosine-5)-methyltransferase 1